MVGAICRHSKKKPPKSSKGKLSSEDDYIPLETSASVPTSPTEMATFYPVLYCFINNNYYCVFRKLLQLKLILLQLTNYIRELKTS